jgi:hypothetical protein
MLIKEVGATDDTAVHMDWDQAQAALRTGAYELVKEPGERGPDQPSAQSPSPGTPPKGEMPAGGTPAVGDPKPDFDAMTRAELEAYAVEKGIILGDAKTKAEILDVVKAAG